MAYMKEQKVRNFLSNLLEQDKEYYKKQKIFENAKIEVYYQSFGRTYIYLTNDFYCSGTRFVNNYQDIKDVYNIWVEKSLFIFLRKYYHEQTNIAL